ncbi:pentatricopeptide repeat-containing protein ELI1, chloroplastic-like [Typha angustifolia]|uniref:pentatricopeptide repeat-containing protein ELI1, chloroplastic-like n=1 Tax=Typha angustifolia TaxID=59011 RepID=UPI003C2F94AC
MISCYAQNNNPYEAFELFSTLYGDFFASGIIPNSYTFSTLLKASGCIRSLSLARQTHSMIVKLLDVERKEAIFVQNSLIDIHAKLGNLVDAELLFSRMRWKDVGSWNTMMDGYTHQLLVDKALKLFKAMREKDTLSWNIMMLGLLEGGRGEETVMLFLSLLESEGDTKPNSSTYTITLTACATLTLLEFGRQMHAYIVKNGFYNSNTFVCNSLVSMYASCGLNNELEQVFDEMPNKDVISWNAVIQGLGQNGCSRKALEIAEKALDLNIYNCNTFVAILTNCSHGGLISEGLNYFNSMSEKYGIKVKLDHYICVIDMLGRAGMLREAYDLLCNMPMAANSVAWSTLLSACLIHKNIDVARAVARELQALGANINGRSNEIEELREVVGMMKEKDLRKQTGCSWVIET